MIKNTYFIPLSKFFNRLSVELMLELFLSIDQNEAVLTAAETYGEIL